MKYRLHAQQIYSTPTVPAEIDVPDGAQLTILEAKLIGGTEVHYWFVTATPQPPDDVPPAAPASEDDNGGRKPRSRKPRDA